MHTPILSCGEQTSGLAFATVLKLPQTKPAKPALVPSGLWVAGPTKPAWALEPGLWSLGTGFETGELRSQGSPDNSWALPFPFPRHGDLTAVSRKKLDSDQKTRQCLGYVIQMHVSGSRYTLCCCYLQGNNALTSSQSLTAGTVPRVSDQTHCVVCETKHLNYL